MKTKVLIALIFCLLGNMDAQSQLLKKIKKSAGRAAEREIIRKTDQKVTTETGDMMDTILEGPQKKTDSPNSPSPDTKNSSITEIEQTQGEVQLWSKYNFVPGDEIIFEDDLVNEENGEFPSRWDLIKGSAENASIDGTHIISIEQKSIISPLISSSDYLSEIFTIEFDAYFNEVASSWQSYNLRFYSGANGSHKLSDKTIHPLLIFQNGASIKLITLPDRNHINHKNLKKSLSGPLPSWKHVAISYNQGSLKVFLNEDRVLNIPNIKLEPEMLSIEAFTQKEGIRAIKNIRIAKGGKDLYKKVMTDGKIITYGILFDTNRATLKPESMGVINEVANLMQSHPELKFQIEGHTDSEGKEDYNLNLSELRASRVMDILTQLGIDKERLKTKGYGESKPLSDNISPEGKAKNRRVEFIKTN
jgi:OmpA-OmpF porin, OOP family